MHVLIVDDQPDVVCGIQKGVDWRTLGVKRILTANSVNVAEKLLLANPIDILLCDIEMPPRNGLELLAFIREQELNPLCIFLTSHAEFTYAQEALRLDAFDYVVQPAPYPLIQESVARAIAERKKLQRSKTSTQFFSETTDDINSNAPADHIAAVIDYIHTNIGNDLNRQEIAESVHLNPEYLSRLFKKEMNLSLNQFIIREKVKLASAMLKETAIPISLIALKVGYSNFSYFSQVFKRQTGLAPLDYRKQHDQSTTTI